MSDDLTRRRRYFAEEIQAVSNLTSPALVDALATVPRERFLGPGPWQVCVFDLDPRGVKYRATPGVDPRHVYHNVAIAIDSCSPNVTVTHGDASELSTTADVILVNAGATHAHPSWLTALTSDRDGLARRQMPNVDRRLRKSMIAVHT